MNGVKNYFEKMAVFSARFLLRECVPIGNTIFSSPFIFVPTIKSVLGKNNDLRMRLLKIYGVSYTEVL